MAYNVNHYLRVGDAKTIHDAVQGQVDDLKSAIAKFDISLTLNDGYINQAGTVVQPSQYNEKYTDKIGCIPGQEFTINVELPSANGMWVGCATYDKDNNFVSVSGGTKGWVKIYTEDYVVPSGVYAISVMYRSFTGGTLSVACADWAYLLTNVTLPPQTLVRDFHLPNSAYFVSVRGINHTGYYTAPENTLPAFRLSKENGFAFVETDMQLTSDNVPVLLHDTTINRTARNADGTAISTTISIKDITYAQALEYDFGIYKGAEYAGTKIPSLEQFIVLCRNLNLHPYIEIKGNWDSTKFAIAYNIVKKYAMETKVTWLSTSINYLKFVAKTDSYARLCYIVETITESVISDCIGLYTAHNSVFIGAMYTNLTTATIQLAIDAGIPVEAYTVNDADTMLALDSYISGVTSDIYDYPSVLQGE